MKDVIKTISSSDYTAKINLSLGANCISLRNKKYDAALLREPDVNVKPDNPYLYGMPILFPVNRISGGRFEFEGREYVFDINEPDTNCHLHGHIHEKRFEITEIHKDFISCSYTDDGIDFGHKFRVKIDYSLSDAGLLHKTEITNLSDKNMPLFLGFHTTFQIPFVRDSSPEDILIKAQIGKEIERDMCTYLPTGKMVENEIVTSFRSGTFRPFETKISCHCSSSDEGIIEITDTRKGIKLVYENDPKYKFRLFYNRNADAYICLEPMSCMANCQNSPFDRTYAGFDRLKPKETKQYVSRIYLSEV